MTAKRLRLAGFAAVVIGGMLALALVAVATPGPIPTPVIRGVAGLPGPIAPDYVAADPMGLIKASVDEAPVGAATTLSATGLAPNKDVTIEWMTSDVKWALDMRPDSVDYLGRKVTKFGVVLGQTTTDASGAFTFATKIPRDFGGLHDIYAVIDKTQVAKGGVLITRKFEIWPKKGPVGTTIHIRVTGLGSPLYESGAGIYYDNRFAGVATANWTRGVAEVSIRAAGPVGPHTIESSSAMQSDYLNPQQSPIPWANLHDVTFTVTRDAGPPKAKIEWPQNIKPTVAPTTTLDQAGLAAAGASRATLSVSRGFVNSTTTVSATGLAPNADVSLAWATVVGNRVNCTGICWVFSRVPLGHAVAAADGTVKADVKVPDGLGGWHVIQLLQGDKIVAQVPYYVQRSFIGISARTVKRGQQITIHLKGVGWTQLDNTAAVLYDNGYIGYGCGFNSNGDVQIKVTATGQPGTHLIDLYPMLYSQNPVYTTAVYGMVPFLSFRRDAPGLAAGYRLPAIHLAIRIVK